VNLTGVRRGDPLPGFLPLPTRPPTIDWKRGERPSAPLDAHRIPLTVDGGFHIGFARLPGRLTFAGVDDYGDYLSRLGAFHGAVLEEGALPLPVLERRIEGAG